MGHRTEQWKPYAAAALAVLAATLTRFRFDTTLGDFPFFTYFAAVIFTAWYGGTIPALVALGLGSAAGSLLAHSPGLSPAAFFLRLTVFLVAGLVTIAFIEVLRRTQRRAEAGADEARDRGLQLERERHRRAEVEARVREREARFNALAAHAPVGIFQADVSGECVHVNERWREITGLSTEQALGRGWIAALHPEDRERVVAEWYGAVAAADELALEYRFRTRDGTVTWVSGRAAALRDERGAVVGHLGMITDITGRKTAERRVSAQHATTRVLAESSTLPGATPRILETICACLEWEWGALWVVDHEANVLRCVETWHDATVEFPAFEDVSRRRTFDRGIGLPGRVWAAGEPAWIADVVKDDNFPRAQVADREGLHGALGFPILVGNEILGVMEFFSREIREPDQDLRGMLLSIGSQIGQFIERKQAEEGLRASEARKSAILEAALDSIVSMDARGRITEFNPAAERTFGYRRSEVLGREMAEVIIPPSLREQHRKGLERYLGTGEASVIGKRIEMTAMRSDGSEIPVELTVTRIGLAGEPTFTGHLRDITERKRVEKERKELFAREQAARANAEMAERRAAFLAEASRVLGLSLDYEATASTVATLAVPFLADWCAVDVHEGDGSIRRMAVAHADPAKADTARGLAAHALEPEAGSAWTNVFADGRGRLLREISPDDLAAARATPEHRRLLRELGCRSAMVVPLPAHGRTIGVLTLVTADSDRHQGPADLATAEDLGHRAGLALDNARLYRAAEDARRQSEAANRAKDEFLATVSHELRTPLTPMVAWTGMLRRGGLDEATVKRAVDSIDRNVRVQAQLIEDLLDVSRIISGKLRLDARPLDVRSAVQAAIESMRPAADAKDIRLQVVLDPDAGIVLGDAERLQQVVWNLLSNAIKFTPKGGRVQVHVERVNSHIEIAVSDSGKGIARELLPHVFERFWQADSTTTRAHGGLGLGLAIVRHLVELHGGTVQAESPGEGQGTVFSVRLPLMVANRDPLDPGRRHPTADGEIDPAYPSLAGLRILVVDDEADTVEVLRALLSSCGAIVRTGSGASEALEVFGQWRPDVLVCDIGMPGQDGYALIAKVRAQEGGDGSGVPAVALTAYASTSDRLRALASGFQIHVAKPIEPVELVNVIAGLARSAGKL